MTPKPTKIRRPAFTLMEVLLVILLLGIVAVFVWPDFGQARRSEEIQESVVRTKALLAMCRAQAMNEARRYRVTFLLDGHMRLSRQRDPISAPDVFERVDAPWADMKFVLDDVWVEAVQALPEGPPPILVDDDKVEFTEFAEKPPLVEDLEQPVVVEFAPDGTSDSIRWIFRDVMGRGQQVTVDGRIGRFDVADVERVAADQAKRPVAPDHGGSEAQS